MKTDHSRHRTLLLCIAIGIGCYLLGQSTSTTKAQSISQPSLSHACTTQILGIPTPQQMMRVVEGSPFVVPQDKIFVATGLGSTLNVNNSDLRVSIDFDGMTVLSAYIVEREATTNITGGGSAIPTIPPGLTAPASTQISVTDESTGLGVLLGYLADAG